METPLKMLFGIPKAYILLGFRSSRRHPGRITKKLVFNGESMALVGRWESVFALFGLHYLPMFRRFLPLSPLRTIWSHLRPQMASFGTIWSQKTRRFSLFRAVKTTCFCVVSMLVGLPLVVFGVPMQRILRAFWASASLPRRWTKIVVIYCVFLNDNFVFCSSWPSIFAECIV